jgi:hypothetical protein
MIKKLTNKRKDIKMKIKDFPKELQEIVYKILIDTLEEVITADANPEYDTDLYYNTGTYIGNHCIESNTYRVELFIGIRDKYIELSINHEDIDLSAFGDTSIKRYATILIDEIWTKEENNND